MLHTSSSANQRVSTGFEIAFTSRIILAVASLLTTSLSAPGFAGAPQGRGLLWRAVQSCLLNYNITGASFPCETVNVEAGRDKGYAVIRAPLDDAHIIVIPTVRTIGIEAERLRGATAPNYFQDAWAARHFATDGLETTPARDEYAMAVNSRLGRSQDQLHIHVACMRRDVKQIITRDLPAIRARPWMALKPMRKSPPYRAYFLPEDDLRTVNVIDLVAHGLGVSPDDMDDVTIAVLPVKPDGFVVIARLKIPNGDDEPHAEALLDRGCSHYAKK